MYVYIVRHSRQSKGDKLRINWQMLPQSMLPQSSVKLHGHHIMDFQEQSQRH